MTNLSTVNLRESAIYCTLSDFLDSKYLHESIIAKCKKDIRYSLITRICFKKYRDSDLEDITTDWKSLGEQVKLYYNDDESLHDNINIYLDTIVNRLGWSSEIYSFINNDILGIQILIYKLDYTEKVTKKKLFKSTDLQEHKELINVSKTLDALNKRIPLDMKLSNLGDPLVKELSNNNITSITLKNNEKIDFLERVNRYSFIDLNSVQSENLNFYEKDGNTIICVQCVNENTNNIYIFNLEGSLIHKMLDNKLNDTNFSRKVGNVISYVDNSGIYNKDIEVKFDPIYPSKISNYLSKQVTHPDWRIGSLDLETYKYSDNIYKVYAIGFHADKKTNLYYINETQNSDELILKCLDDMLIEKYNRYTFYVHNLGGFDVVYLLNVLVKIKNLQSNTYDFDLVIRDNTIISMTIFKRINNKRYTIKLVDSYNILPNKLSKLCETFDTEVKKSQFPYAFVNKQNLFYMGDKPDYSYYINRKESISMEDYNRIASKNWSMKEMTLSYLKDDLESLYSVMKKFSNNVFINYNTHTTSILTISGLAMNIFLRKYYENNIPLINKKSIFNDIKKSYFGGITEVYKPYGKNLYYYDVNSLYPYSALKPMPGLNCVYKTDINKNIEECVNEMFGFYECEVETNNGYLGLLPTRDDKGVYMPNGIIKGWFFSEEVKFAFENGYKIKVLKGYQFDKQYNIFDKYIKEFYNLKSTTKNPIEKSIAKSLLNNLLGRFGMNIYKSITQLMSVDELNELLQCSKVSNLLHIGDKILVTYEPSISHEICDKYEVDYNDTYNRNMKMSLNKGKFKEESLHDVSIVMSAAITSYSRIFMNQVKLNIIKNGGNIYYTDTDSIVTDIELDSNLVGLDIGQFKLEHKIAEGYFISNKTYALKTDKNEIITKTKGVNNPLNYQDFIDLYNGKNIKTVRYETVKDFNLGSVKINNPRDILISSSSYTKRTKIFDNESKWIDTRPLTQSRGIHTLPKTLSKKKYSKWPFLLTIFISITFIFLWFYFSSPIPYEYILNEIYIEDFCKEQNIGKFELPKNNEVKLLNKTYNIKPIVDNKIDMETYLKKSKIIRLVYLSHMESLVHENNFYIQKIKDLETGNIELQKCISDVNDLIDQRR